MGPAYDESLTLNAHSSLQDLLGKLPTAAYMCDADGLITYFNRPAVQLWGREPRLRHSADRFCGSFRLFAVDGSPLRHDQCWMALTLRTGKEFNRQEIIIERADGSRINALAHANPIRDELENLVGAVNILVDVTDRRRAEDALTLLSSIVESSEDAIIGKTLDGRIRSWNSGAERLFEFTADEAIGSSIEIILPPDRLDEEKMILSRLSRGERIEHYETVRMAKSGRRIDISLTISPIRDQTGRIMGASKIARDITARKQGDADLQQLHEMSVLLASTLDLPIILGGTLRTAAEIEGTRQGLLFLWDREKAQLRLGASLGFESDFPQWVESAPLELSSAGLAFQRQERIIWEDIERYDLNSAYCDAARRAGFRAVHSTPLITRKGEAIGVMSTHFQAPYSPTSRVTSLLDLCVRQAVDFIENARLHDEQKRSNCHKDEFLATLSHELRNPLAPLSNALSVMRLSGDPDPSIHEMRRIMENQVSQMERLVEDLLQVSRIDRGKLELRLELVELSTIVASAVEASRPMIDVAGHELTVSLPSEALILNADACRLTQVLSNLLNNAAKYTPQGGRIWLTAHSKDGNAVISVRDTGFGIAAEMLPRVFDKFIQVGQTINNSRGGLGIGLSLAKYLVEQHSGHIEAHSDGLGKGCEFIVRIPREADAVSARNAMSTSQASTLVPLPYRRILLVDDTRAAVYVMQKLLEKMGQSVRTEYDAEAALEFLRGERPDIVISDISMPGMNGYELARSIRQHPELDDIILVALTGFGQDSDRCRTKEAGFDHHLVKPVSLETLQDFLFNVGARCAENREVTSSC